MAEYIEREKLISDIDAAMENAGMGYVVGQTMKRYIKRVTAANVAPVRHGRWLTWEEKFPGYKPRRSNNLGVFCDKCHNHADNRTDFCPNCGARMDRGIDNG